MQKVTEDHRTQTWIIIGLFCAISVWWAVLFFIFNAERQEANLVWAACYQIIAILGAIFGLFASIYWGGFKSLMGRAIIMFALGLLLQAFGQSAFSYYNLISKIEIPYPSLADVGFFGSIPLYIYGISLLGKVAGARTSLRSLSGKTLSFLLPALMLAVSYFFFLRQYEFDWSSPVKIFFDFAYPFGQAMYVSIAILTYMLSKKMLGGIMKNYVLLMLFALAVQYISDFNFLFQASRLTWINGGYGDYLYFIAYLAMALSLIKLNEAFQKIKNT